MTIDDLIQAGYKPFKDHFKNAKEAYQKRIGRTRYFINVYHYDWREYNPDDSDSFECDLQFKLQDEEYINLLFNCTRLSIEDLEKKVEKLFINLECSDYEE